MARTFQKDGETKVVETNKDAVNLAWRGWSEVKGEQPPAAAPAPESSELSEAQAALEAAKAAEAAAQAAVEAAEHQ